MVVKNFLVILVLGLLYATISFADFSPDGKQLVFSADLNGRSHIFISDSDGQNAKRISRESGNYYNPVWSPRGDMIAFEKTEGGYHYIGVMELDGSGERMIAKGYYVEDPAWTPDGLHLIYYKTRKPKNDGSDGEVNLFIVSLTGYTDIQLIPTP